ncbi:imidazolonepropionase-like domain-containing protein [Streptomyces nitrosporeus]|uniref:Aminodeoxyfutalosine deaminase/Imidazolonepropionase-like composite domain-containing protein n=1 Tax=Streptomyces nitrosporeus TaxID=28894 RepID=A0A5J6F9Q5_9ACTN|nr:hypothetical protein [Streptomyces nitrosporeus]QEU72981.1 hypothetical protein CP967_14055 [Streptomyces nitrosporeus]GGZ14128.1 hypothetical protein GCM10010327_51420 [Streptomyces nitrosporeus]
MLTIHAADAVLGAPDGADAVAVDGGVVVAVGPYDEIAAAFPAARPRRWSGLLTRGLVNPAAVRLLEEAYHPDPREADELGTRPLTGEALAALAPDEARWGASARRGLQRMLRHGTTAVAGTFTRPSVRTAVLRSGLRVLPPAAYTAEPPFSLDPLEAAGREPGAVPARTGGPPAAGEAADLAVFGVRDVAELAARGAGSCVATVLGGRLLFRAR